MSNTLITVRHTELGDDGAVHKIFTYPRAVWGTLQLPFPSAAVWPKRLAEQSSGRYSFVACAGEEIVEQLWLWTKGNPRRHHAGSLSMAVRDDWQGKGVGYALMQAAVDLADRWLGLTRLELTVYTDDLPAVRLYEKFGFVNEHHRRGVVNPLSGCLSLSTRDGASETELRSCLSNSLRGAGPTPNARSARWYAHGPQLAKVACSV